MVVSVRGGEKKIPRPYRKSNPGRPARILTDLFRFKGNDRWEVGMEV
jgi:hypothetical protein